MIGDAIKAVASFFGLAEFWSKYFGDQQKEKTGAQLQQGANDAKTLDTIVEVAKPVSTAESDKLWNENKTKFGTGK
jgi:hypothetical protein